MAKESPDRIELLQGTLDLLILRTLLFVPAHGHQIAKGTDRNLPLSRLPGTGLKLALMHKVATSTTPTPARVPKSSRTPNQPVPCTPTPVVVGVMVIGLGIL